MNLILLNSNQRYRKCPQFIDDAGRKEGHHSKEGPTVLDHIKNIQLLMKNDGITDKLDLFIAKYHDIGKFHVLRSERNREQIEINKTKGKNLMPYFEHELLSDMDRTRLVTIGHRYKLTPDEIFISLFVIRHHMLNNFEAVIHSNKRMYDLFKDFPLITDKTRAIKSLITLVEYDDEYEISPETKNKILNEFSEYVKEIDKQRADENKIHLILRGEKLGSYIMFKMPNIPGPLIGELKHKIYLNIDNINKLEDIVDILKKEKPEYIQWNGAL